MNFEILKKNQPKVIKLLENSFMKNRLVHTYLFEGPSGTNKVEAAFYLACLLFCENSEKPCLKCKNCQMILNKTHPSVFYITPETEVIKKQQIESLIHEFSLTALVEGKRVFIIDGIEKANIFAANSILKFLEEMHENDYGILISENLSSILPTIRSRSQIINFHKTSEGDVVKELVSENVDEQLARVIVKLTNSVSEGLELANDKLFTYVYDLAIKIIKTIILKEDFPLIVLNREGNELLREKEKKYHHYFLNMLVLFNNDMLYFSLGNRDKIVFYEVIDEYKARIEIINEKIIKNIEYIMEMKERINSNVNLDLLYTDLFIETGKLNG
ncbi:MAG: hypothetical protein PHQ79_02015 [Bacilli bacterium]|nr:hypothetical protein [Bacilli bacterium]